MGTKKTVSRREALDGNSLTKQFYDPDGFRAGLPLGWSPALVVSLGAVAAQYGSTRRSQLFDELRALGDGPKNQGALPHVPLVPLAGPCKRPGLRGDYGTRECARLHRRHLGLGRRDGRDLCGTALRAE